MKNQLNRGLERRLMYVENKEGDLDGARARIGWVTFSKSGKSVRYRGRSLARSGGQGVLGNYYDEATGEEFWVSGVKRDGSNTHPNGSVTVVIDEDAAEAYQAHRASRA
jgi:hypothetical protein